MAGCFPITKQMERADTVRPKHQTTSKSLNPIQAGMGRQRDDQVEEKANESDPWEEAAKRMEELETRVTEHFEDQNEKGREPPPIIKEPVKPTQEEWERHQVSLTPYQPWCPHCIAGRNARRGRPCHGRKGKIVSDTEGGDGPTNISMDYM